MGKTNIQNTINGNFTQKDILSLDQFSSQDLTLLFTSTDDIRDKIEKKQSLETLKGKIITLLFYEPSSRTFASFASAVKRLGGQTIDIVNPKEFSSVSKGETLDDTIRVFETYSDAIVLRHDQTGSVQKAAKIAYVPIINAGDGIGEHPTQALLDLYTIHEKWGRLDNLVGLLAGDMRNGRTIKSLIRGLSLYPNNTIYLLAPHELQLSSEEISLFIERGITLIPIEDEKDIPKNANFWYWTRTQKERFPTTEAYERVKNKFVITNQFLTTYGNTDMIIMHPLPRVGEIDPEIDENPRAVYLTKEITNGLYIRMALLTLLFGKQ